MSQIIPTVEEGLWVNEAPGSDVATGCLSAGLRNGGWPYLHDRIRAAKRAHPAMTTVFIKDPWGRYEDTSPLYGDTLLNQRSICLTKDWAHLASARLFERFITFIRGLDLVPEVYLGYPPANMTDDQYFEYVGLVCSLGVGFYIDGASAREPDAALIRQALKWGAPFVGIEAQPSVGSVYYNTGIRAAALEITFLSAIAGATVANPIPNPTAVLYRGTDYAALNTVKLAMRSIDKLYMGEEFMT